jgi:hypothetical protein
LIEAYEGLMFILDKSGKIIYTNKKGATILHNRFSGNYKGPKKGMNTIYDLIHDTSKETVDEFLNPQNNQSEI